MICSGQRWIVKLPGQIFATIFKRGLVTLGSRILILEALILQLGVSLFPDLPSEIRSTRATITTQRFTISVQTFAEQVSY